MTHRALRFSALARWIVYHVEMLVIVGIVAATSALLAKIREPRPAGQQNLLVAHCALRTNAGPAPATMVPIVHRIRAAPPPHELVLFAPSNASPEALRVAASGDVALAGRRSFSAIPPADAFSSPRTWHFGDSHSEGRIQQLLDRIAAIEPEERTSSRIRRKLSIVVATTPRERLNENAAALRSRRGQAGSGEAQSAAFLHNGPPIDVRAGETLVMKGMVGGAGDFIGAGTVAYTGAFHPGNSPALITYEGDVVFGSKFTLEMELAGTARGTGYDAIDVTGKLTFDGTLDVLLIDGFQPQPGHTFDLFNWGTSERRFHTLNLPALQFDYTWDSTQLYVNGTLVVVPEPTGIGSCVCGAALFGARRWRRI